MRDALGVRPASESAGKAPNWSRKDTSTHQGFGRQNWRILCVLDRHTSADHLFVKYFDWDQPFGEDIVTAIAIGDLVQVQPPENGDEPTRVKLLVRWRGRLLTAVCEESERAIFVINKLNVMREPATQNGRNGDAARAVAKYTRYARNTFRKDCRVNIRLSSKDLDAFKRKAQQEGLPYQTLMASVLHKYVKSSGT